MVKIKKKKEEPHWIHHTHFLEKGEYECSVCCRRYREAAPVCPGCKSVMAGIKDSLEWVDETEEIDWLLEDL